MHDLHSILLICIGVPVAAFVAMAILRPILPLLLRRWCCQRLGWHDGLARSQLFDNTNLHGRCSACGKEVIRDSQGNWF